MVDRVHATARNVDNDSKNNNNNIVFLFTSSARRRQQQHQQRVRSDTPHTTRRHVNKLQNIIVSFVGVRHFASYRVSLNRPRSKYRS